MSAAYRVLYVDDEPDLLEITRIFLESSEKFSVETLDSAPAALELLKSEQFDVIISDYQMPVMDGIEFLKEVRNTGNTVPFIIFTGKGREEIVIQAINEGADFYLQKGGEPESQFAELAHKITMAVDPLRTKEALRVNEEKYRTLFETMATGVFYQMADGTLVDINPAALRMFGLTYNQFTGRDSYDPRWRVITEEGTRVPPEQHPSLIALKTGKPVINTVFGVYNPERDGYTWLIINAEPQVRPGEEKPFRVYVTMNDITERKQAEEQLKLSEWRQRLALQIGQIGTFEVDLESGNGILSDELANVWGIPDNFTGNFVEYCWDHTHPDDLPRIRKEFARVAESHTITDMEFRIITPDGEVRWISWKGEVNSDPRTGKKKAAGVNMDITGRKRREEELKIKNFAIESSINAIAFTDLKGNLTYVNQAFLSIMGYEDLHEVLNKPVMSFWTYPDAAKIFEGIQKQDHWSGNIIGQRKDGTPLGVQVSINLIPDASGKPVAMMGSFVDITERVRAEESVLKINRKLQVLSRLTREDLNNKILVLNSYLDLAKIQLKRQDSVTGTLQKLEGVVEQISRINEYTKDYQDMGVKPPQWQNLRTVMLLGLSHIPPVHFQHSLETGQLEIFADPLMEKVCQHFFEDSVLHGKHVTRVRVWHAITPGGVTIFYEDDGIGIPQEMKEKIFLRDVSSRIARNSLIFAREILDITGIGIKETGEPGKGARFEMHVPEGAYRFGV